MAVVHCKMCVIHFHPRVASVIGSFFRVLLRYGWIPCMLFVYMFPPQANMVVRDGRSAPEPEAITARIVTEKGAKLTFPAVKLPKPELPDIKLPKIEIPNIELPSLHMPNMAKAPVVVQAAQSIEKIIETIQTDPERQELFTHYDAIMKNLPPMDKAPISKKFIFHNKMPKSGSTTMKHILTLLAKRNDFTLDHQRLCIDVETCEGNDDDGAGGIKVLRDYINKTRTENSGKYLLLKHHHWVNMTEIGLEDATFINVVRDPVARFASRYYFNRFGWGLSAGARRQTWKNDTDINQTLDECVENKSDECIDSLQVMVQYLCGTDSECGTKEGGEVSEGEVKKTDWEKTARATERAKVNIVKTYYMIGVLEHFDETLALFDKMLPEYFAGAKEASRDPIVTSKRESSKTSNNAGYSNATREALEKGLLRYEMDLYNLCKAVFFKRLDFYGITP